MCGGWVQGKSVAETRFCRFPVYWYLGLAWATPPSPGTGTW